MEPELSSPTSVPTNAARQTLVASPPVEPPLRSDTYPGMDPDEAEQRRGWFSRLE